jgi:hypothetical protein
MEYIYYLIIVVGAVMVYGSSMILKKFKKDNDIKAIIGLKFAGLGVAIVGILKVMNVF